MWAAFWNYETDESFSSARDGIYRKFPPDLLDQHA